MAQRSLDFPDRHAISRARFFLESAEECGVDEREAFEAHLEAAIVFGRSALHRLKHQYSKHSDWDEEWWNSLLTDPSVDFFIKERNVILKEGPPKRNQKIYLPTLGPNPTTANNNSNYSEQQFKPAYTCSRTFLFRQSTNSGNGNCPPSPRGDSAACRNRRSKIPAVNADAHITD